MILFLSFAANITNKTIEFDKTSALNLVKFKALVGNLLQNYVLRHVFHAFNCHFFFFEPFLDFELAGFEFLDEVCFVFFDFFAVCFSAVFFGIFSF